MADAAEVGKYGTVRFMKRRDPNAAVASFPIDDEECTFGRDTNCSIRLYYQWVSSLHCKIIFEERKAFLQVYGTNGVTVDNCQVLPVKEMTGSPTTVPLVNGSIIEIHNKRFMFNYPPKELRTVLFTPRAERRRSLRMSMIHSAQVFSPRPSHDPMQNLRILQSPLKPFTTPKGQDPDIVTLVDGNHPKVVEEEQDLIILEDVDVEVAKLQPPTPVRSQTVPSMSRIASQPAPPPVTPRRRSAPSLHRAVLIRSAQRAAHIRDLQPPQPPVIASSGYEFEDMVLGENDAEEEEEVEEAVSAEMIISDESEDEIVSAENQNEMILDGFEEMDKQAEQDIADEQDITEARNDFDDENIDPQLRSQPYEYSTPLQVSRSRQLGAFMTPQPRLLAQRPSKDERSGKERTGPQRPPPGARFSLAPGMGTGTMTLRAEERDTKSDEKEDSLPIKVKPEITDLERRTIIERRKSALTAPDPDFGFVPGLGGRRTSALPPPMPPASPFRNIRKEIEEGRDTKDVLKQMEESLEVMRRKSVAGVSMGRPSLGVGRGGGLSPSPKKSIQEFSLLSAISSPIKRFGGFGTREDALMEEDEDDDEKTASINQLASKEDVTDAVADAPEGFEARPERLSPPKPSRIAGSKEKAQEPWYSGLNTPSVRGVRELFQDEKQKKVKAMQTPRMDGMRNLFREERHPQPASPVYDFIAKLMDANKADDEEQSNANNDTNDEEKREEIDIGDEGGDLSKATRVPTRIPKTVARSKATRPVRGLHTDSSTMADDEASPDLVMDTVPRSRLARKTVKAVSGLPEGAIVHRSGRLKKAAGAGSDVEETNKSRTTASRAKGATKDAVEDMATIEVEQSAKPTARRGRPPKARPGTEGSDASECQSTADSSSMAAPVSKPRSKSRKADSHHLEMEPEMDAQAPAVPATTRRSTKKITTDDELSAPAKPVRRGTRSRSRSVDPEGEQNNDPLDSIGRTSPDRKITKGKRAVRSKVASASEVETIPEEDEPPLKKAPTSRQRKAKMDSEDNVDEHSAPKQRVTSRKVAQAAQLTSIDEDGDKDDKENTPSTSPVSPTDTNEDVPVKPSKSKTTTRVTKKPASKAIVGEATTAPRATRTRVKK